MALLLIIGIVIIFDISERIDDFVEKEAPLKAIIFDYYVNFIPYFMNMFSPLFVFITVIFFTSKMAADSEIVAILSCGISFHRMMVPYIFSATLIAILSLCLNLFVIPEANKTRLDFEEQYFKNRKAKSVGRNVHYQIAPGEFVYAESFSSWNNTAYRFSLDKFVDKKLVAHLTAKSATYDTTTVHKWTLKNYMIREMDGMREKITKGDRLDSIIKMEPRDFLIMKGQQETMTSSELSEYIDRQRRRGFANIKEFEIEYHKRIAMSFASFILTIIGVSLSSRKVKGGMGLYLGVGLGLSFSYILFQTVSATFAINGNASPILAVWIPNILYPFIAIYLYRKAPK